MASFTLMYFLIILLLPSKLTEGLVSLKWIIISDITNNFVILDPSKRSDREQHLEGVLEQLKELWL
uniref:Uncharacterized protein n=1 Tax=Mus spicilegus TaxID=10103 RepID=A0A8C6G3R8_MUSSI